MKSLLFVFLFAVVGSATRSRPLGMIRPIIPHENALEISPNEKAANPTTICNDQLLNYCHIKFNGMLGISTEDWRNFDKFVQDVWAILGKGVDDGLLKLCAARTQYYGCLAASYSDCMSKFHFLRQGYTLEQAIEYVEIFAELEFMCDGGLLQTIGNWNCIWNFLNDTKQQQKVAYCEEVYDNKTRDYPDQKCAAADEFLQCIRFAIVGCGNDAVWWQCEINRVGLEIAYYCPALSCSYGLFNQASISSKRYHLFRSPNPYFMPKHKQELFASLAAKATERAKRKKRSLE